MNQLQNIVCDPIPACLSCKTKVINGPCPSRTIVTYHDVLAFFWTSNEVTWRSSIQTWTT